jgi:hypothetical protein
MPVRRLGSIPEYDDTLWLDPADPALIPTIAAVWERSRRLCPPHFPAGLYKHASIEDANRLTLYWERQAIERARAVGLPHRARR